MKNMKCHSEVFHSSFRQKRAVFQDQPRGAEGQNPLERLEQKISNKESVTKDQVSAAYDDAVENLRKGFTGDADKFETEKKSALDALAQKRDKMMDESDKLQKELETRKIELHAGTKQAAQENITGLALPAKPRHRREKPAGRFGAPKEKKGEKLQVKKQEAARELSEEEKEKQGRKERFNKAVVAGWNATDPTRSDAIIDDYYDWVGARDKHNDTRRTLAGYIAGLQMQNPNLAGGAMKIARQEFDTTADMWGDKSLTFDSVRDRVIGGNYLSQIEAMAPDLTAQAKGLLAALLRLSDDYLKTDGEKKAYIRYLAATIKNTNFTTVDVKNDFFEKEELPASINIFARSRSDVRLINAEEDQANKDMNALSTLQTPADWRDYRVGLLNGFKEPIAKFKESTKKETADGKEQEFLFENDSLNNLYEMDPNEGVEDIDPEKLDAAAQAARDEMSKYLDDQKKEIDEALKGYPKDIEDLKKRSAGHRYLTFTDEEWKGIDDDLKNVATISGDLKTDNAMNMDEVLAQGDKLTILSAALDKIDERLDNIDKAIAESTDKETAFDAYMSQKNLAQTVEGGTYKYGPKDRLSDYGYNTTFEGVKCTFNYLNDDVKAGFGAKVNGYLKPMLDKALNPAQAAEFDRRLKAAGNKQEDVDKAYAYANKCFYDNCKKDEIEKIAFVQGLGHDALSGCTLEFDHLPTAEELQQQYDDKFVGAWKKAGEDLDSRANGSPAATGASAAGSVLPSAPGGQPGGGAEPRAPEAQATNRDNYKEDWENGNEADLPQNFVGNHGGFEVVDVDQLNLRDHETHAAVLQLDRGTGAGVGNTEIILFQPDKATGRKVDGHVFVEVNYRGRTYWAASDRLKPNEEPGAKTEVNENQYKLLVINTINEVMSAKQNETPEELRIKIYSTLREKLGDNTLPAITTPIEVSSMGVKVTTTGTKMDIDFSSETEKSSKEKAESALNTVLTDVLRDQAGKVSSAAALEGVFNERLKQEAFPADVNYATATVDKVTVTLIARDVNGVPQFSYAGLVQWVKKNGK